jgi:hypothetical protein
MQALYFILAAVHIVSMVVSGMLWTYLDLNRKTELRNHLRDIRAVHFGSLYLVPWFLGLAYAFDQLHMPEMHQLVFPVGVGLLLLFSSAGYVFPLPEGLDPFYYWTRGWPMVLALIGLTLFVIALIWTAVVLIVYSVQA